MATGDVQVQFLGGAGTVTGSKFLVSSGGLRVLVDCGLFQGLKNLRLRNWEEFPFHPSGIHAVVLTHAHLDHSGYLPKLVRDGFRGPIYATPATIELCKILLRDAAYLMEEDAAYSNRKGISRHRPALPLYSMDDVHQTLERFVPVEFGRAQTISEGAEFDFHYAGHILGAAMVHLRISGQRLLFSGDLGRLRDPLMRPPVNAPGCDALFVESTYGNRSHPASDPADDLEVVLDKAYRRGGVVLIPAFAVGRSQQLLHLLAVLKRKNRLPQMPIYLNSPMATKALNLLCDFKGLHRLTGNECEDVKTIAKIVGTVDESKALNERKGPMVIISASGMLTGGRVIHHLKAFAPDPKNIILLTGFQAAGTRGQALHDGATEVKVHGSYVAVRAEVIELDSLSAHADAQEILEWMRSSSGLSPRRVFVTHGEPAAADELRRRIVERFGWTCDVAELGQTVEI